MASPYFAVEIIGSNVEAEDVILPFGTRMDFDIKDWGGRLLITNAELFGR